jgi:DNA-binding CsgD family transcriptional regulator
MRFRTAGPDRLLERASELALLEQAITAAIGGMPRVVLLDGAAGIGKTALLLAARHRAEAAGFRVLAAQGGELERELGSGIVRQLFEPLLLRADEAERAELLARPAAQVAGLFGLDGGQPDPGADEYGTQNALYWLCARIAERAPLMIAIDDVHWSDATSLRWLAYMIRRLQDLPMLLVLARRTDEPGTSEDLLARIAAEPAVATVRPAPLSLSAVHELVGDGFEGGPEDEFVRACHHAAGGNPLFTLQLLETARAEGLRPGGVDALAVAGLAPKRVSQLVCERLRRLSPDAVTVAEQVAVLGTYAEVRHVRALSELTERRVLDAGDELAGAGLLRARQPLEFIHPVVRSSVYESVAAGRRAGHHGRAARLLGEDGAAPARVAMHLLKAPPAGDAWAVGILRAAAAAEIRPEDRVTYLRRAVAEPPAAGIRAEVLLALGEAESLARDPRALEHLNEALRLSADPTARAVAAGQLAYCLLDHDRAAEAEPVLRTAIAGLSHPEPTPGTPEREPFIALQACLLEVELSSSGLTVERLGEAVSMAGEGRSPAELDLLGFAAYAGSAAGATAAEVIAHADRALRRADLAAVDGFRLVQCAVWALEFADRLDEADQWWLRIQDAARRGDWPVRFAHAASARAQVSCRRGALADAEQDARAALELDEVHGLGYGASVSPAPLVMTLTEQGRLAEADAVLAAVWGTECAQCDLCVLFLSRGWLRLAQGRAAQAAQDFGEAGRLARAAGHDFPGFWPWRVGAATALLALGQRAEAAGLAREELDRAQRFGAAGPVGVALRTVGLVEGGTKGLDLLAAASQTLARSPSLLERARADLEFGAALRRSGQRGDAGVPLRRALDLADRCGANPLAERAREEIRTAGGRPRRTRIRGVEALTASELRVAQRAAQGSTNREIAQELFVTTKTVEKHLASAYRKLGIEARAQLAEALSAHEPQRVGYAP